MDKARDPIIARSPRPSRAPGSMDFGANAASCSRFLVGDGPRKVEELLKTVPTTTVMDYYGAGGVVTELESEVATLLGKPSALFLPTGTMAQQATLRVHADRRSSKSIAFHPCCHLETHEERGYQRLHGLFGVPVGSRHEPLSLASLRNVSEPLAALLLELPQRDLGGTLPTWKELCQQVSWARERGAAVHLDGARLWEAAPYYAKTQQKSVADVAGLFDSVYVSFYKGLGAIAGCCVAGETDVIDELSVWRTR
ncbi:MAG TPA: beta-eliminating lyase-related protein, partial [Acidimicrobiales bacterium]|nr:beta-eliminating lyase-related protein [Acidimicrobiales bacterium]